MADAASMRRRWFMREFTRLGQAYRWERDEALRRAAAAESRADAMMDRLVEAQAMREPVPGRRLRILIECDDLLAHYRPVGDEYERLARRIVVRLANLSRDVRGDLRQTEAQRMLGL